MTHTAYLRLTSIHQYAYLPYLPKANDPILHIYHLIGAAMYNHGDFPLHHALCNAYVGFQTTVVEL